MVRTKTLHLARHIVVQNMTCMARAFTYPLILSRFSHSINPEQPHNNPKHQLNAR
jgi:hypothetical protein